MGHETCEAVICFTNELALFVKEQYCKPKSAFLGMSVCLEGLLNLFSGISDRKTNDVVSL